MKFEEIYLKLNPSQKEAVDKIDGPVMVVAGPGTGKTQVLSARIASILKQTDVYAENILCLTFTDAATVALRKRLIQFIGTEAYRVSIHTYHSFCHQVIQDNQELFGINDLVPVSELEQIEIMREIIDALPNNHLLKRFTGDVYFDLKNLAKLFDLMKKDNLSANGISASISTYLQEIENSEDHRYKRDSKYGKKGELKPSYYDEVAKMDKLKSAAELYNVYQSKLAQRKRYDFNDMIIWVINLFAKNEHVLLRYQEQYQYFLVDEYQDTNGAQNDLLYTLINYWDNPNVFVVGDDDQSIYKFQGANVRNITDFYTSFQKHIEVISLKENYRSSQNILNASNALIKSNEERLVNYVDYLDKDIEAANAEVAQLPNKVKIVSYPNAYQEIIDVSQKIRSLEAQGTPLKEIAVLYRNHNQSVDLMKYLQSEGISFNVAMSQNVLDEIIILQLISLLEYLDLESTNLDAGQHLLFNILHFNNFEHLKPFQIAQLSLIIRKSEQKSWRNFLNTHSAEDISFLGKEAQHELKTFVSDIEYWLKELHNKTLQKLVEEILSKAGFITRALAGNDSTYDVQCLKSFYNLLKEETAKKPDLDLHGFLHILSLMKDHGLGLNLNKIVHGENGVNLMTAHRSKGLEFDHVFMIGCTDKKWERSFMNLPFNLNRIIEGEPDKAAEEESRRLFYVGITRAKRGLNISYYAKDSEERNTNPSIYVTELALSNTCEEVVMSLPDSDLLHFFDKTIHQEDKHFQDLTQLDFISAVLDNFRMSATNLNSYLRCSVSFFYQNIIKVPSAKNESMTFGTAVHYALDRLFKDRASKPEKQFADSSFLVDKFVGYVLQNQESFTKESLERRLSYGKMILPQYYEHSIDQWNKETEVNTEVSFHNSEIEGVPVRGEIDKLILQGKDAIVVDYKTGKYQNAKSKLNPPVASNKLKPDEDDHNKIFGGDYWRQVHFYKLLIEGDPHFNKQVIEGVLDFVEPVNEQYMQEKMVLNTEETGLVRQQIISTYAKIMNREFTEGCNKEDCMWCNFNKYYLKRRTYTDTALLSSEMDEIEER